MTELWLLKVASILVLGIAAQWIAWRLRLPSILLLLAFGFLAGPVTQFLDPDVMFGNILFPIVSISVAIILLEGGLSLKLGELHQIGKVFRRLICVGATVTWLIAALSARLIFGLDWEMAALTGAILVVTGPTVIGPLLRFIRPVGLTGPLLKWEGIVIDPIGAVLAVLIFEVIRARHVGEAAAAVTFGVLRTVAVGGLAGLAGAGLLVFATRRNWLPDHLQSPVTLMVATGLFAISNALQPESGLVAVTALGLILANQRLINIRHIVEFKENLRLLLISGLFIVLAARIRLVDVLAIRYQSLVFLAVLIFAARPLSAGLATIGTNLGWRDRLFLAWMAPRGIVAAAVSSVFALRLTEMGYEQARLLVPITFAVIVGTVTVYGLTAMPVARWLRIAKAHPQGVLFAGAQPWVRAIAALLKQYGYSVLLVDTSRENVEAARAEGLPSRIGSILAEDVKEELDLSGIGRILALTANDEVNSLAALHFVDVFGRSEVYQLGSHASGSSYWATVPRHLRGRVLFGADVTGSRITGRFANGAKLQVVRLTPTFSFSEFQEQHAGEVIPLFVIDESSGLHVFTANAPPVPRAGQIVICMVGGAPVARA